MTTTTDAYYLVESSGDDLRVWGLYGSLAAARGAAGCRHVVVSGETLAGRKTITRDAYAMLLAVGSIREV